MKKVFQIIIPVIILSCVLSSCSAESKGVPDSVILSDACFDTDSVTKYEVKHNIDKDAHIDNAELILYYEGDYGTQTIYAPYTYQYDKSNDLWKLKDEGTATGEHKLDEKAYISASPWTGNERNNYVSYSYSITFIDIDTDNMTARIQYQINFAKESIEDISRTETVEIIDAGGTYNLHFLIPYTRPGIVYDNEETLWFWLDISYGVKPF